MEQVQVLIFSFGIQSSQTELAINTTILYINLIVRDRAFNF